MAVKPSVQPTGSFPLESDPVLLGLDEVGRGPWAGPLVIGAVILGPAFADQPAYLELNDSKKLSARKREQLSAVILAHAVGYGLGWVAAAEIDRFGLGPSLKLAARRAVQDLADRLRAEPHAPALHVDQIIIDGTVNFLAGTPLSDRVTLLPKADAAVKEVSAASIIAKVARDRYMLELAAKYPGYGFENHVGYGTAAHRQALSDLGPCPEHRRSVRPIAALVQATSPVKAATKTAKSVTRPAEAGTKTAKTAKTRPTSNSTATGQRAERIVAAHLETLGHQILAHNYKTATYEIDLISLAPSSVTEPMPNTVEPVPNVTEPMPNTAEPAPNPAHLYFTEVKYRRSAAAGSPLSAITAAKRAQMSAAAQRFLATHPDYAALQPLLAVASVSGPDFHLDDWFPLAAEA